MTLKIVPITITEARRLEVEPRAENLPLLAAMDNRRTEKP